MPGSKLLPPCYHITQGQNNRKVMYKVTKSLIFESDKGSFDFIGCHAKIFHELPTKVGVIFEAGKPLMIDKKTFFNSVEESTEEIMTYHDILDVTIMQQ